VKFGTMEEPTRIAKLPHYKGIPVTYTTLVDDDGIPNFKAVDSNKAWEVKREGKCSICGEKLDYWIAFMTDEKEAEERLCYDNPNHEECLRFAFNMCPWLYFSKATYSNPDKLNEKYKDADFQFANAHPNRDEVSSRPPKLGIYVTNRYDNVIKGRYRIIKMGKPKRIEWMEAH
jgi:hypothetical protein